MLQLVKIKELKRRLKEEYNNTDDVLVWIFDPFDAGRLDSNEGKITHRRWEQITDWVLMDTQLSRYLHAVVSEAVANIKEDKK